MDSQKTEKESGMSSIIRVLYGFSLRVLFCSVLCTSLFIPIRAQSLAQDTTVITNRWLLGASATLLPLSFLRSEQYTAPLGVFGNDWEEGYRHYQLEGAYLLASRSASLYLSTNVGWYQFTITDFNPARSTTTDAPYLRQWTGNFLVVGMGIRAAFRPAKKAHPYLGIGYQVWLPTKDQLIDYRTAIDVQQEELPVRTQQRNGLKVGGGMYMSTGYLFQLATRWQLRIGSQLLFLEQRSDYAPIIGITPRSSTQLNRSAFTIIQFWGQVGITFTL